MNHIGQAAAFLVTSALLAACPAPQISASGPGGIEPTTVCGEALAEYQACGWDESSPGRARLQETVDSLYTGSCPDSAQCEAECFLDTALADPCWECEFTDADCFGDEEIFNPLMDCLEACPTW